MFFKRVCSYFLRRVVSTVGTPWYWFRERRRWRKNPKSDSPRIFYGYEHLPGRNQTASGGMIKFQDLQDLYPNKVGSPNILYLVSSALPPRVEWMIRAAKAAGAKVVVNQNGVAYYGWHGSGWESTNKRLKNVYHSADYILYQSRFCKTAAEKFLGKAVCPTEILHNCVNTAVYQNAVEAKIKVESVKLLAAGSHGQSYRVFQAIHCLHELLNRNIKATLTLAGKFLWRPDEAEALKETGGLIDRLSLGDHVKVRGAYTQNDALKLFSDADILLHAKYNDACPRLIVEALASGLPIVYSASGGVPELVGAKAGVGIEAPVDWKKAHPPDPKLMADAVQKIMSNYDEYCRSAQRQADTNLDIQAWKKRHTEIFENLFRPSE